MRILLSNDDGFDAPGIRALRGVAEQFGETFVVAPRRQSSGCGHQMTLDDPIHIEEVEKNVFSVDGTPADSVRIALHHIVPDVDWVLSGINQGGNLGMDIYLSGTVAAAREAAWHGVPSIALSQYYRDPGHAQMWSLAAAHAHRVLSELFAQPLDPCRFWNVNFPDWALHTAGHNGQNLWTFCPLDPHPLPADYRVVEKHFHFEGDYHGRRRAQQHDVDICFSGGISITLI